MGDRSQPHDKAGPARPECAETSATTQDSLAPIPLFHRLHMTICQAPGFDPKSFLSLDQMGVLTPPLVKGELRRCMPTLTELDLDRYTTHIAAEIVSGDVSAQGQTKPPFSKTFLILILLDMLGKIPVFISEGFTDSMLPIDHSHFRGERASRPYAPSLTGVLKRCFDDWTPLKIENFMSMQWVVLSPIFSGTVGNITLYDFDARIIMPFVYDNLVCLPYGKIDGHNHVRKVKIHPSHHNFEQNQEEPYFALKELHCKTTEEFKYEVAMLRQSAVNARSSFISPLAVFRHGTSFYSLSPWNDDMLSYSKETSLGLARRDSLSKWVIQHGREIAAALNEVDHDSDPAAETKVSAESIKTGISSCDSNEGVELDDIVWLGSSTYSNGPPTAVNTIGLEKLYTRLEAGLPDEQPCAHTSLEDDVKGHSPGPAWFIGCVLLEDIAWMLHGFEEVVSFSLCPIASKAQDESASMKDGGSPEGAATLPMGYHRPSAVQTGRGQVENIAKRSYFVDLVRLTQKEFMNINWKTGDGAALIIDALRHLQAELPKPPTPTRTTALHLTVADGSSIRSHPVSIVESLEFCSPPVTPILSNLEDNAERPNRASHNPNRLRPTRLT
ncbi:hypothetical protein F4821DRAFT_154598 [Hypoxylon rubiginosum]|uniref:Uncharacterized protein n=1 Tax=Hypoxylon rubiginosum TaxID=110542 RepID=A0ACC0CYN6_9PEZI|nr:hypothetical protein F4821DRAFT_154598 [Hypoxylon rubiginosum]